MADLVKVMAGAAAVKPKSIFKALSPGLPVVTDAVAYWALPVTGVPLELSRVSVPTLALVGMAPDSTPPAAKSEAVSMTTL